MIAELRIRDLATIADVTLPLGPGLNVLTGETGAGKSMLVDALALLLGERADSGLVRPGASKAVVEGALEALSPAISAGIDALGLDADEGHLVIRREVSTEGRSRAWVNGSPTTASVLAQVGALVVDLHGQHETQSLLRPDAQCDILDLFAHAERERSAVAEAHALLAEVAATEADLVRRREEVRRRADYLQHVVTEIDAARIRPGEEDSLQREARRLMQAGALGEHARYVADALDAGPGNARAALASAERSLGALEKIDPECTAWRELLDGAYANIEELARLASAYADGIQEDPERLDQVERRRDLLATLMRKHGDSVAAVLAARDSAAAELDLLDRAELDLRALAARRTAADAALRSTAAALSARRSEGAARLSRGVSRLLPRLGLPGGKLSVALEPLTSLGPRGAESVTFLVQLNVGHEARPLARSASGGELSRIMLALKVLLARHDAVPTLVFDEVDQGIGGETGAEVGAALADVAGGHQVLVITHLPQIAARADRHLAVSKGARAGIATSTVDVLHGEDRVGELARMLGDAEGDAARRHAQALLSAGPRAARRK
jgi:DNA repair protein RecN (Recombination protein N)